MTIKLPRLGVGWDTQPGLFQRYWNDAMSSIEDNINSIAQALAAAISAQGMATGAQASADAAQLTANSAETDATTANANANTRVPKNFGASWSGGIIGTQSRGGYLVYASPTISNPPTQAEVQALSDSLQGASQKIAALMNDLQANESLTT